MVNEHMRRGLLLLAAVGVAVSLAGPAHAITRTQANAIALRTLKPQGLKGPAILFGLSKPLAAKTLIREAGTAAPGAKPRNTTLRVVRPVWLFWLDEVAYARFTHPSRMLLVDDRTGKVVRTLRMSFYPVIGKRRAPWLRSWGAYESASHRVWSNLPTASARASAASTPTRPGAVAPGTFANDCLVSIGLRDDPLFSGDFGRGIVGWAQSVGLRAFKPGNGPGGRPAGAPELASAVSQVIADDRCKDVFIFASGHGFGAPYNPGIQTGDVAGGPFIGITPSDLRAIMRAHPQTTFKIKLNGCYTGRFVEPLRGEPNLLVLETAANTTEYSWGKLPRRMRHPDGRVIDIPDRVNPGRSEFVNGNIAGLNAFFASAAEVSAAQARGDSVLATALERAFALGAAADGARGAGLTHPMLHADQTGFTPRIRIGYRHLGATSEVCGIFGTEPAQPGASYTVTIVGPGVADTPTKTGVTASLGEGAFSFGINSFGTYTVTVTITSPAGLRRTVTATVTVTGAAGTCPG